LRPIPWARVRDWNCLACGECCKWFVIPLRADELARILHTFGEWAIEFRLGKAYIRKPFSRCIFQYRRQDKWLCALQEVDMKPVACKLWPFIPLTKPKYGRDQEAAFEHLGERFYVYVDPRCPGISLGRPSSHLVQRVLPEIIELRLGMRTRQNFTTSRLEELKEPLPFKSSLNVIHDARFVEPERAGYPLIIPYPGSSFMKSWLHAIKAEKLDEGHRRDFLVA